MRIINEVQLDFSDVLLRPKRSTLNSRKEVILEKSYTFKWANSTWSGIPILAANMDGVGTIQMAETLQRYKMITALTKDITEIPDNLDPEYFSISSGTSEKDQERLAYLLDLYPHIKFITLDVANGYSEHFAEHVAKIRDNYPNKVIIAGNVVTGEMTEELILRGASVVKVGIGPGSACTTRIVAGVGRPQLSAIIECADAAHGLNAHVISDGGLTCPGDFAKAFSANADFCMSGGYFAGHDEGGGKQFTRIKGTGYYDETGDPILKGERKVQFYGMSSETAMQKHHGGVAEYRASEGRTVEVPFKGPVSKTVQEILGGLRSACTYTGAATLKDLPKCATFYRVTNQYNKIFTGGN